MYEISLKDTSDFAKRAAIKKVGFELEYINRKMLLIDTKAPDAEKYVDLIFSSLNEVVSVLAGYLIKEQIKVVA